MTRRRTGWAASSQRGRPDAFRDLVREHRHDLRRRRDDGILGAAVRLDKVAHVADASPAPEKRLHTLHVDGHGSRHAASLNRPDRVRVAAELLRHEVEREAVRVRGRPDRPGVGREGVHIEKIRAGA